MLTVGQLQSIPIMEFRLNAEGSSTIAALIERLESHASAALSAEGLDKVEFERDGTPQWAVLKVSDLPWRRWFLGLQFVRFPEETGAQVKVYARIAGMEGVSDPDIADLKLILPKIRLGLEKAAKK